MLDFICPTCGHTSFDSAQCTSFDGRADDAGREDSPIET
jgi:hypothetical protein